MLESHHPWDRHKSKGQSSQFLEQRSDSNSISMNTSDGQHDCLMHVRARFSAQQMTQPTTTHPQTNAMQHRQTQQSGSADTLQLADIKAHLT